MDVLNLGRKEGQVHLELHDIPVDKSSKAIIAIANKVDFTNVLLEKFVEVTRGKMLKSSHCETKSGG